MLRILGLAPVTAPDPGSDGVPAMASTTSMPSYTSPKAEYAPSSDGAAPCMMKNCDPAELGSDDRAIDRTPRRCLLSENSFMIW